MSETITREDIEGKFRELQGELGSTADDARGAAGYAAIAAAVLVVLLAFFLGRRSGKAGSTVVEIRRI
ncbi:MAG: hypothetical protein S0880_29955 [Actinomycetota bacterium]|nr:hypothetical protein [Actinomycetota bacterium]